ncbi:MAG: hypothetical protein ACLRWH_10200 [Emergencia sp.]
MIFSDSPSQKALERMMTQVKGFPPQGSGVMVLRHFEYTAEMCDCRLCLYYNRKKKCTVSQCPCIEERIVAGAAGRSEVMTETMKDIHNAAFRKRLKRIQHLCIVGEIGKCVLHKKPWERYVRCRKALDGKA